jgi:hypothetical protein
MSPNDLFFSAMCTTERTAQVREFDIAKLWSVLHLGKAVQESVSRAARSRLNRLIKEERRMRLDFEDNGQDLLWVVLDKNGFVIDCNAQTWCWVCGRVPDFRTLIVGWHPLYERAPGYCDVLNFKVSKITRWGTL